MPPKSNERLEARNHDVLDSVSAETQNIIDGDVRQLLRQYSFVERYKRVSDSTIRIYGVQKFLGTVERKFKFCAVLQALDNLTIEERGLDMFSLVSLRSNDMQMSMLVNVGELVYPTQLRRTIPSVVRLQLFDDDKGCHIDAGERGFEEFRGNGNSLPGDCGEQRKPAFPFPPRGESDTCAVTLDEFESQVIERGAELVQHLPDQDRDVDRGCVYHAKLLCAITLIDDKISFVTRVSGGAKIEGFNVIPSARNLARW